MPRTDIAMSSFATSHCRQMLYLTVIAMLLGCSREVTPYLPPLEGTILWDDGLEPRELEGSTVEFESKGKVVATAGLTADGTFMLIEGLPEGTYRVRLQPPANAQAALPARFQKFDQSGFTFTAPADTKPQTVSYKLSRSPR